MPPVVASTRRLSRRSRNELRASLAAWAIVQATSGGRRNFTGKAILLRRRRESSAQSAGIARRPAALPPAGVPPRAHRAARFRQQALRSPSPGRRAARRNRDPSSRGRGHPPEDAVDEAAGLIARESLGELDRLIDRRLEGNAGIDVG